ncbi:unnamed protein product [Gemmata massiliana]|uniref:Uncharacterized protein n=2 Tax=Gemmata massiliana TaxID=1210884 RepID=A0A6P2DJG4_9BACT|nr:unnamed protein product [Gemmata massiliana]
MARQTSDAQLVFRADKNAKIELEAIAAALDRSSAKLLRDMLAEQLPKLRAEADEEVKRREKLPHGVTQDVLEDRLESLVRKYAQGDPIHIEQQDLLSPESKAVWVLLSYIWGEHPTDKEREAAGAAVVALAGASKPSKPPRR